MKTTTTTLVVCGTFVLTAGARFLQSLSTLCRPFSSNARVVALCRLPDVALYRRQGTILEIAVVASSPVLRRHSLLSIAVLRLHPRALLAVGIMRSLLSSIDSPCRRFWPSSSWFCGCSRSVSPGARAACRLSLSFGYQTQVADHR